MAESHGESLSSIDATQLERIARIARSLPGRVVSVKHRAVRQRRPTMGDSSAEAGVSAGQAAPAPLLRIDGVAATEIVARYEHAGLA
jgi:hypothetical protein